MNILKTYRTTVIDEENIAQSLVIRLFSNDGIYGCGCSLEPAGQAAEDTNVTDDIEIAERIFDILCAESVLPLELYAVLDDMQPYTAELLPQ